MGEVTNSERIAASLALGEFPKQVSDEEVLKWKQSLPSPRALIEQACCISKSGSVVTIDCNDADYANDLFDWLSEYRTEATAAKDAEIAALRESVAVLERVLIAAKEMDRILTIGIFNVDGVRLSRALKKLTKSIEDAALNKEPTT